MCIPDHLVCRLYGHHRGLTPREREVFQQLGHGCRIREIASALCLSVKTVETHIAHLRHKLGLPHLYALIAYAARGLWRERTVMNNHMRTIWKFPLGPRITLQLPKYAQILTVQSQGNTGYLWVLLDPDELPIERTFHTFATGESIGNEPMHYIGTFQLANGTLVFHTFEVKCLA